jgi:hypothetical protein
MTATARRDPAAIARPAIARRDALRVWAWLHMRAHPETWFTTYELARVIRDHYACEPRTASMAAASGTERSGRSNVLAAILPELRDRGDIVSRPHDTRRNSVVWRYAGDP